VGLFNLSLEELYLFDVVIVGDAVVRDDLNIFILGVALGQHVDLHLVHLDQLAKVLYLLLQLTVLQ
jgi:hypothetical protein